MYFKLYINLISYNFIILLFYCFVILLLPSITSMMCAYSFIAL